MKSRELLSIVLSLIIVLGVTAGSAYAQTNDIDDTIDDSLDAETFDEQDETENETDRYDLEDKLDRYCEMTDEEKRDLISKYDKAEEHIAKMDAYCELDEDERDVYIEEHKAEFKMNHDKDIKDKLERYCEMSEEDKRAFLAEHDKAEDHAEKMNRYSELDENARMAYIEEHKDEYKSKMKDYMSEKSSHMDYDRLCALAESDRAAEITDSAKLDRISEWCNMTPEEREDYKRETHDSMKEKMTDMKMDKVHDQMKMS
ncbi:MAG: ABC transporter substrate-binding protein, partial [Nitrosopumilaceae archaeon]